MSSEPELQHINEEDSKHIFSVIQDQFNKKDETNDILLEVSKEDVSPDHLPKGYMGIWHRASLEVRTEDIEYAIKGMLKPRNFFRFVNMKRAQVVYVHIRAVHMHDGRPRYEVMWYWKSSFGCCQKIALLPNYLQYEWKHANRCDRLGVVVCVAVILFLVIGVPIIGATAHPPVTTYLTEDNCGRLTNFVNETCFMGKLH